MKKFIKYFCFALAIFSVLAINKSNVSAKEINNNDNIPPIQNLGGGPSHYVVDSKQETIKLTYNQIGVMVNDINRRAERVNNLNSASFITSTLQALVKQTKLNTFIFAGTLAFLADYNNYWGKYTDQTSIALAQAQGRLDTQRHRKAKFIQKYKVLETGQKFLDGGLIFVGIE
ncbi:hypothetical protein [Clostridium tepidum]|uniref:Uncharacterized protein n=1 Tax=Clostridium tepidum TaxID=1962263 RepID=A0ABX3L065_9CLOT|nr:hypothetical protein [Clostridium tepidum]OOO61212.1 hypothetical protein BS637_13465 [Clostridium tepidum]